MSQTEYFFFEWLIIQKQLSEEQFKNLTHNELETLKNEFSLWFEKIHFNLGM
jgi:hypothetical protein